MTDENKYGINVAVPSLNRFLVFGEHLERVVLADLLDVSELVTFTLTLLESTGGLGPLGAAKSMVA